LEAVLWAPLSVRVAAKPAHGAQRADASPLVVWPYVHGNQANRRRVRHADAAAGPFAGRAQLSLGIGEYAFLSAETGWRLESQLASVRPV